MQTGQLLLFGVLYNMPQFAPDRVAHQSRALRQTSRAAAYNSCPTININLLLYLTVKHSKQNDSKDKLASMAAVHTHGTLHNRIIRLYRVPWHCTAVAARPCSFLRQDCFVLAIRTLTAVLLKFSNASNTGVAGTTPRSPELPDFLRVS